jgi:hypothetical protein
LEIGLEEYMRVTCLILLLGLLAGCGDQKGIADASAAPVPVQWGALTREPDSQDPFKLHSLPGIPTERDSSVIAIIRDGVDTYDRSAGAEIGSSLVLIAPEGGICWAIWQLGDETPLPFIDLDLTVPLGNQVNIALADYERGTWEIQPVAYASRVLPLDPLRHISPAGNVYVALILFDGAVVTALQMSLLEEYTNQPPQADFRATPASGEAPLNVALDARDTIDPDDETLTYLWDFEGDGIFDEESGNSQISHEFIGAGVFATRLQVIDEQGESSTYFQDITVNVASTNPPLAVLEPEEAIFNLPAQIRYTAYDSQGGGGGGDAIVLYELDLTGDGIYEKTSDDWDLGYSTLDIDDFEGTITLHPRLRVTDLSGNQAVDTVDLTVGHFGTPVILATNQEYSGPPSIAIIGGYPAIAYYDYAETEIRFRIADDTEGNSWKSAQKVVELNLQLLEDSNFVSLVEAAGRPAICYGVPNDGLKFLISPDTDGATWDVEPKPVADAPAYLRKADSMKVINQMPAVLHASTKSDFDSPQYYYSAASTPEGAGWFLPEKVAPDAIRATFAEVEDLPAICYQDWNQGAFFYKRAAAADLLNTAPVQLFDINTSGSIALIDGKPSVVFANSEGRGFLMADDVLGDSWGTYVPLEFNGVPSVVISGNLPTIAMQSANSDLQFNVATDSSGTAWNKPVILDSFGNTGQDLQTVDVGGKPGICYWSYTTKSIYFLRPELP